MIKFKILLIDMIKKSYEYNKMILFYINSMVKCYYKMILYL